MTQPNMQPQTDGHNWGVPQEEFARALDDARAHGEANEFYQTPLPGPTEQLGKFAIFSA
ncbi:MAG: hypothetical protein QG629_729 [Patescibacteria group bacterium]|nr:hypothetical protein [Candidatus Saccharibacteria bacterium]MDQ5963646.1 hypothetical protein [Patescibacteria group bacterium]